jgi:hypothetical protein
MAQEINPSINSGQGRNIPRDLFLHLLAIVTLYWSAISFVTLLWQYINYFIPDVLNYYGGSFNEPMRFAIASLIIVFPVFILVSWFLNRIYKKEYVVRESKIRKWLLYFTLFASAVIVIGDLVSIINTFLGGDITTKFILKALSILLVAGLVFWYYLDDVRREIPTKLAKSFAWATCIIVLVGVVEAFFIVGSPATARLIQFDQQKVSDLQGVQSQVVNYWQRKQALPSTLNILNDPISGFKIPLDPQNKDKGYVYEYNIKDAANLSFELCATFNKEGADQYGQVKPISVPVMGFTADNWSHASGRVCFERTIDKQLYPPLTK